MSTKELPEHSRVWIFQANRQMNGAELSELHQILTDFVKGWQSHGKDLSAGFEILEDTAILIAVDESVEAPSGCSIDKVFRLLTDFSAQTELDLFNRLRMVVKGSGGFLHLSSKEAEEALKEGRIQAQSPTLNSMVLNLREARHNIWVPFEQSWLGKKLSMTHT